METAPQIGNEGSRSSWFAGSSIVAWLRDAPWLTPRRLAIYPKLFLVAYAAATIIWLLGSNGLIDPAGHPIGADFITPWSASRLALNGTPAAVYNVVHLWPVEKAAVGSKAIGYAGFYYPPTYLLMVLPLAVLPYAWSLLAWTTAGVIAYLGIVWKIDPERDALWLAIAFPGALINLTNGQNGFLTTALLGGALLSLERRPILAGTLFGLMTYKPQFGVLVPLFLLATGRWRAFIAALVTLAVFAALSLALFGAQTWQAFFSSVSFARHVVLEQGGPGFGKLQSTFAAARLWRFGLATSYGLQAAVALLTAIAATWVWRRTAAFALQAAALATGTLLMSPYMMDYDLVVLALGVAWLALEGRRWGFLPWEKSLLVFAWLLPLMARTLATRAMVPLAPIVLLALLAATVRRSALNLPRQRWDCPHWWCTFWTEEWQAYLDHITIGHHRW